MKDMFAALESLTDREPGRRDAAAMLGDLLRGTGLDADTARLTVNEPATRVRESALI
ncbi:hypothetical protein MBT84_40165 [Streptomyces sp. MBT84]|uniref:hypothetical protein n=1 Tax=unclassified Streptomyces TaxID=2593676 RepID=UPI000E3A281D|nr:MULTISPECIES: hypothetical protein [unclassified Streptomyces]MBW8705845.1 hypothetical protein [Streptomyces sp. MBT84]REE58679.1 hypothetical protein BX257_1108 [Streptomyces sp. 3212.3]